MDKSRLSNYFSGIAAKKLSAVEANPEVSNQHELNGVTELKEIFGDKKQEKLPASFFYLDDKDENIRKSDGFLTWYDSRENHPTRSEFRLYYQGKEVSEMFREGDLVIVGKRTNGKLVFIAAKSETTVANQLVWLFDLKGENLETFHFKDIAREGQKLGFATNMILDELGIELETDDSLLEGILAKFGQTFPSIKDFSGYARDTLKGVIVQDDPDGALMAWMNHEEKLFRTLEKRIVSERLKAGFGSNGEDVDAFIGFSLSVQNRRKARVGGALENHLEHIFKTLKIRHSHGKVTENKTKPDFIFPSIEDYLTPSFPAAQLTMLGSKSTCKDRWRQVLSEAKRILEKHLLTLEPSISEAQTDEMKDSDLQLVIPKSIHETYSAGQQKWLMTLSEFIKMVQSRDS
jgi:hypothetical protein